MNWVCCVPVHLDPRIEYLLGIQDEDRTLLAKAVAPRPLQRDLATEPLLLYLRFKGGADLHAPGGMAAGARADCD